MMKVLRVGIIGQGRSGRDIHAEFLKNWPEQFKIVAVCDLLKDRCERAEKEYGCKSFQDYREMINDKRLELDFCQRQLQPPMRPSTKRSCSPALTCSREVCQDCR